MKPRQKLIIVAGPTGIGKTRMAISLANSLNGEIISADSMQIYKYMDIGTAKPTKEEQAAARHHMIDVVAPDEPFDAALFSEHARAICDKLNSQNKTVIIAGGTGLYIKALTQGLFRSRPADPELLAVVQSQVDDSGPEAAHRELKRVDPASAQKIHMNDTFRVVRALEYFKATGTPISESRQNHGFSDSPFDILYLALEMDRNVLYDRINRRVDIMISDGLLDEASQLMDQGYSPDLKSMGSIGYKHMCDFLQEKFGWDETVEFMKRDTRRYAKRQLTWFRHIEKVKWLSPDAIDTAQSLSNQFLEK